MITTASLIATKSSSLTTPNFPFPLSSTSLVDLGFLSKSTSLNNKKKKKPIIDCAATKQALISINTPHAPYPQTPPHWNPLQRAAATAIDTVERALLSHPLPKSFDPLVQLAGNFAPVAEHPVLHSLPITGTIPDCINGVYLRNGPNPFFKPIAGHNFLDGDGMVHAVTIKNGAASYACRFTKTERLLQERKLGRPVFPKTIGEVHGHAGIFRLLIFYLRGLFGIVDFRRGTGPANTGLVFFNGKLLAMSEEDLPYELRITPSGDLKTVGRYNFDGQLNSSMIAHPKIDPESGELFALSNTIPMPYLTYFRFSPDGKKSPDIDIKLTVPTMIHDFAITKNFVVIPDHQVVFKVEEMMMKGGSPVIFDGKKKSRFGVLSKHAENGSDIIWVESPDTFCFHLWNAWEEPESNEVVVIGSCMNSLGSIFNNESGESFKSVLSEIRLDLKKRESTRRTIVDGNLDLEVGMVNQKWLGRKTRYAYLAIVEPWPKVSGFAKVDLVTGEVKKHRYGEGRFGGEPFFLGRGNVNENEREDDGYVMVLVHDESTSRSELQIVNAVDFNVEATVKLPSRVPYGLHGTFVDANDLAKHS